MSVTVEKISRRFSARGAPAVSDTSFAAPGDAITALLGPSGSGKTTVLRIIAGLEEPDGGRVLFDGEDITRVPARRRGVGLVFQGYALFQDMSVADNIAFGLKVRRMSPAQIAERVEEMLQLVQLTELAKRRPRQLSGGQQQRVAFARALAPKPRVLLLDEPFGALDARVRMELREWLLALHERAKVTTLLVTHDQEEALELAEHVVVMNQGRVEQAGAPAAIYDHPATPFVASFVGGASVLRGKVAGGRAEIGAGSVAAPEGAPDGAAVSAYVRPHDVRVAHAPAADEKATVGRVRRLTRVGGWVKVDVALPTGEEMTVQMSRIEVERLRVTEGDPVMVDLLVAKVFVDDYSI